MAVRYLETFTAHFMNSDTKKQFPDRESALEAARNYVGNNSYAKPFPGEETYLFGPGNGETSVMVRQDVQFDLPKKEAE